MCVSHAGVNLSVQNRLTQTEGKTTEEDGEEHEERHLKKLGLRSLQLSRAASEKHQEMKAVAIKASFICGNDIWNSFHA